MRALLAGCDQPQQASYPGYAEGEYVFVAAGFARQLERLAVTRGAQVEAGSTLFVLEHAIEEAALAAARARTAGAQARFANLSGARRAVCGAGDRAGPRRRVHQPDACAGRGDGTVTLDVFSLRRWFGVMVKEFIQLRRDRLTFGMIIGIPVLQLLLFGFAINTDPKHLPTAVYSADSSPFTRSFVAALQNTGYFRIVQHPATETETEAERLITENEVQFVLVIPADFTRRLLRGESPQLLLAADASDPTAVTNAAAAVQALARSALARDLSGALARPNPPPVVDVRIHRRDNPEGVTAIAQGELTGRGRTRSAAR